MEVALITPCQDAAFAAQSVAYTGTAGVLTGWAPGPQGVTFWSDQACYVRVGKLGSTTATVADLPVPGNTFVGITIPPNIGNEKWTVSAIQVSTGGTIYCKPFNAR